jgi:hypothetical protein
MMDYENDNIEISELQAVDFALGTFIAKAFAGQRNAGSKEWREFLTRPIKEQIYRGDHDDPAEFVKALQKATGQSTQFPVVYYFRKPGFTNSDNNKGTRSKAVTNGGKSFDLITLPISLDYRFYLLAWDKPTLDKMALAWYAYICAKNAEFAVKYQVDSEVFAVSAVVADNRTVTLSDITPPSTEPGIRHPFHGVMTGLTINTQILQGAPVPAPPDTIFIEVGLLNFRTERYSVAVADGQATAFAFDTTVRFGKFISFQPGLVEIHAGRHYVGRDNGSGLLEGAVTIDTVVHTLTGTVDYETGAAYPFITPPLPTGSEVSIKYGTEQSTVATSFPGSNN